MARIRARAQAMKDAQDAANGEFGVGGKRLDALKRLKHRRGRH